MARSSHQFCTAKQGLNKSISKIELRPNTFGLPQLRLHAMQRWQEFKRTFGKN